MEELFTCKYVKKDMLSRTNGPAMRVNTMHITVRDEVFDGNNISVGEAKAG
jgi:hypothetical protein